MKIVSWLALMGMVVNPGAAWGQGDPRSQFPACYDVVLGEWRPPRELGLDSIYMGPPSRIFIDTVASPSRLLRGTQAMSVAPLAIPSIHDETGWRLEGDSVILTWSTGFSGVQGFVRESERGLQGVIRSFWDFTRDTQTADLELVQVPCGSTPEITVEDLAPLPESIELDDGSTISLGSSIPTGPAWTPNALGSAIVRRGGEAIGLGAVDSIVVRVEPPGVVAAVRTVLDSDTAFDTLESRLTEAWGPPLRRSETTRPAGERVELRWMTRVRRMTLSWTRLADGAPTITHEIRPSIR